jgi:outer membrane protein assembly factor BamB
VPRPTLLALAVVGLAAAAGGALSFADWPQWRGPARDGLASTLPRRAAWPAALVPAWKVSVGIGHSSPVVAGGRVFQFARQGDEEALESFDRATGRRVWRQAYPAPYTMNFAAFSHGKGPKSTPVVAEGRVFTLGIGGVLSAFDAASGRVLWRQDFVGQFPATHPTYGTAQSPAVDGDHVIVHVGGPGKGALTAFDAASGAVAWAWPGDGPAYASPIVADLGGVRQVVTFTESMLVGVSADAGQLLWKLPFTTSYDQTAVTPIASGDTVIFSGLDHPVKAIRIVRRGTSWAAAPVWENAEVASYMSTPVLVGGRLFGLSQRRKGQLFCLDAATGRTVWLAEGRQGDNAALVAVAGAVLALTTEGQLLVIDPAAPTFTALRRYTAADNATWAHPAVVEDGVLVKDAETLSFLKF